MSTMNPKSFARLIEAAGPGRRGYCPGALCQSQPCEPVEDRLRELKTSRSYFEQLEELFLSVNAQHADGRLGAVFAAGARRTGRWRSGRR